MTMQVVALNEQVANGRKARLRHCGSEFAAIIDDTSECMPTPGVFLAEMTYHQAVSWKLLEHFDDHASGIWEHTNDLVRIRGRISALHEDGKGGRLPDLYLMNGPEFIFLHDLNAIDAGMAEGQGLEVVVQGLRVYLQGAS